MASVVRSRVNRYRRVLDKATEIKKDIDRAFKAYLLAAYDLVHQTEGAIMFPNPWASKDYIWLILREDGIEEIHRTSSHNYVDRKRHPIENSEALKQYLNNPSNSPYYLTVKRLQLALKRISKTWSGKNITEEMVKKKLKEFS
jgi:hypothetical protein